MLFSELKVRHSREEMMNRVLALVTCGLSASVIAPHALASTVCVSTVGGIQSTLIIAQTNGEDDRINIVAGSYSLTSKLNFSASEARSLTMEGGWNSACTAKSGTETILDGQNSVPVLNVFNAAGSIHIEHLTFVAGRETGQFKAPIDLSSNSGNVYVELNQFLGNRSTAGIGALAAYSGTGHVYFRNNLLVANRGGLIGGVFVVQDSGEAYVTGNTISGNTVDTASSTGGLAIGGNAHFTVTNNILWNNLGTTSFDFLANTAHSRFNNDIGILGNGVAADQVVMERYVDPQFAPCSGFLCLNFRLKGTSPLVNGGVDAPLGGQTAVDLDGQVRTIGVHVDIGAYESDVLFADDFE